jgi:hypothetical protein
MMVDLGAERTMAAEREGEYIAIEMKSCLGDSGLTDFYEAFGQYHTYLIALHEVDPDRKLYLATTQHGYNAVFERPVVQLVLRRFPMSFVLVDLLSEEVSQWIH